MNTPITWTPEQIAAAIAADPVAFVTEADAALRDADAEDILRWARMAFGPGLAVTAAMGDTLLAHLAGRVAPGVDVLFVDTGYHFPETLGTADAVKHTYPVNLLSITPVRSKEHFEDDYGTLYGTDPDLCCALRKLQPLDARLAGYSAWATGLRRDDSPTRADTPIVQWDATRKLVKIAPIAAWRDADVEKYHAEHPDVLVNPLVDYGYKSIGCAPCTRPVAEGEDARAGRWAGRAKTECGLHYSI